ncbi:MAG TPA: ABC transporter permease subunit, partial [Noviherbaspirillum sp.]|nr:ABC transporter permease subunit [Noviherbaspirillum sp.]
RVTSPNAGVLGIGRGVLSVVRAIPDILYALLFVAAVGVGPLPGIAALILFNIGVIAKLLSETVDGVDPGPIEAGRAAGATRAQTVRWGVLPQVMPNYIAYSLYVFELNIRASTVLGIVGAGGIGGALFSAFQRFDYDFVLTILATIIAIIVLGELLANYVKRAFHV